MSNEQYKKYKEYPDIEQKSDKEKIEIARDPETDPRCLEVLCGRHGNDEIKLALAGNKTTPIEVLRKIFIYYKYKDLPYEPDSIKSKVYQVLIKHPNISNAFQNDIDESIVELGNEMD